MPFTSTLKFVPALILDNMNLSADNPDVVMGKNYIGKNKTLSTGTLPLLPQYSNITLNCSQSHSVEYGKNPAAYTVTAASLADQTVGDAIAADIKLNKIGWVNGIRIVGTMPLNLNIDATLGVGEVYNIPIGYHDGIGKVTAQPLGPQTPGTATANDILSGKTAWVNGVQLSGLMANNGSLSVTLSAGESHTLDQGYYSGGAITAKTLAEQTQADPGIEYHPEGGGYVSTDVLNGSKAWINGILVTGNIPRIGQIKRTLNLNETYPIPQGYHDGTGYVTQNIPIRNTPVDVTPSKNEVIIDEGVVGHYMGPDAKITVHGVTALRHNRELQVLVDEDLTFVDGKATVALPRTNWRNNISTNIYGVSFANLKDSTNDLVTSGELVLAKDYGYELPSSLYRVQIPGQEKSITWDGTIGTKTYIGPSQDKCYVKLSDDHTSVNGFLGKSVTNGGGAGGEMLTFSIDWDGDITGKESVNIAVGTVYKIANNDHLPNPYSILGATFVGSVSGEDISGTIDSSNFEDTVNTYSCVDCFYMVNYGLLVVISFSDTATFDSVQIPKGIWFIKTQQGTEIMYQKNLTYTINSELIDTTITWDGDTTGKPFVPYTSGGFYRIHDGSNIILPTIHNMYGAIVQGNDTSRETYGMDNIIYDPEAYLINVDGCNDCFYLFSDNDDHGMIIVAYSDSATIDMGESTSLSFTKGIWFSKMSDNIHFTKLKYTTSSHGSAQVSIDWDGDTTGKETVDMGEGACLCKLSNDLSHIRKNMYNDVYGSISSFNIEGNITKTVIPTVIGEIYTQDCVDCYIVIGGDEGGMHLISFSDSATWTPEGGTAITFTKGIWFLKISDTIYTSNFTYYYDKLDDVSNINNNVGGSPVTTTITDSMITYPVLSDANIFNINYTSYNTLVVTDKSTSVSIDGDTYILTAGIWDFKNSSYTATLNYNLDNVDKFTVKVSLTLRELDNTQLVVFESLDRTLVSGTACIKEYLRAIEYT